DCGVNDGPRADDIEGCATSGALHPAQSVHEGACGAKDRGRRALAVRRLLLRWVINVAALLIVAYVTSGFHPKDWTTLAVAALVFGLLNAILRPILAFLTLPLTILTLGLFAIVLNAILLELTDWLVMGRTESFLSACIGATILGLISLVTNHIGREQRS